MSAPDGIAPDLARVAPLRRRMAAVYGVEDDCVLPVRGYLHALALLMRIMPRADRRLSLASPSPAVLRMAKLCDIVVSSETDHRCGAIVKASPGPFGMALGEEEIRALMRESPDALLIIDEREIETAAKPSMAFLVAREPSLIVYREISPVYGANSSVCGAVVANPSLLSRVIDALEPDFLQPQIIAEAQATLAPQRLALLGGRLKSHAAERKRVADRLQAGIDGVDVRLSDGPHLVVGVADADATLARARALDAPVTQGADGFLRVLVMDAAANDRTLAAFGAPANSRAARMAEVIRETKETKIAVRVDLDRAGDIAIDTGIGYYDHMLEQIAAHGGFSLRLACIGDRHVDLHHTIEDCALALGGALAQALGERRGIARYGFLLPMDEAEAKVSIDLGGRPYAVFEGSFAAPLIGDYPTEMTSHVFRSLATTLGAAIHISVKGENDHHKTEAAFKAFARALRSAIAIAIAVDVDAIPSTKGVI